MHRKIIFIIKYIINIKSKDTNYDNITIIKWSNKLNISYYIKKKKLAGSYIFYHIV